MYVRGMQVDWAGFDRDYGRRKTELPSYPFQRRRYWAGTVDAAEQSSSAAPRNGRVLHPLLGRRLVAAASDCVFESQLAANHPAALGDQKIQAVAVLSAAACLEMGMAASAAVHGKPWTVCQLAMLEPLPLEKTPKTVQTVLSADGPGAASFRIVGVTQAADDAEPLFTTLAAGRLESPPEETAEMIDLDARRSRFPGQPRDELLRMESLRMAGLEPGPAFCWMLRHWVSDGQGLADLRTPQDGDRVEDYHIHPGLLDTAFQLLAGVLPGAGKEVNAYVPMGADRVRLHERPLRAAWCVVSLRSHDDKLAVGDAQLVDGSGRVLVTLEGLQLRRVPRDWLARRMAGPPPDWCYELTCVPQPLDTAVSGPAASEPEQWLVFDDQDGMGAALTERLEMKSHRCFLVRAAGEIESRRAVVHEFLSGKEPGRRGIVYLSGAEVDGGQQPPDFEAARQNGWGGVLDVLDGLTEFNAPDPPRLWLVTRGARPAGDRPLPLDLAQSPIWGLGRVIASEYPTLRCTRIDLDPEEGPGAADALVEELLWGRGEDEVAYRGGQRRVARLRPLEHGKDGARDLVLREDGAYLITGGLGGLGLKLARWLADRGARHLVLLGRSAAPPEARPQLEELQKAGVHVVVRQCDVGKREAVATLLSELDLTSPPLRGIFHLAGVLDDGVLREQTRDRFDRVMAAKVLGAWNLHDLTRQQPLDLFVLFSSAAALLGSPGQGNYAAANAFLDALAHQRRWEKRPALSVNWGSWAEVGMAARLVEAEGRRWSAAGIGWIEPSRGLQTLERLLVEDRTQAGVLPIDWRKFFERIPPGSEPAWLAEVACDARSTAAPADAGAALLEELRAVTPAERLDLALTHIRREAARVLALEETNLPDPRRTLNELGFDSLTAVEFANRVGRSIGRSLNPTLLFDYPTLERLAAYVVRDVLSLESEAARSAEPKADAVRAEAVADVEKMSEEDLDATVLRHLEQLHV
jgi:NAD(P)-dependent dehydrogenase (short-subunit alcohol dehydrogenase family)/acyl carrier protein